MKEGVKHNENHTNESQRDRKVFGHGPPDFRRLLQGLVETGELGPSLLPRLLVHLLLRGAATVLFLLQVVR